MTAHAYWRIYVLSWTCPRYPDGQPHGGIDSIVFKDSGGNVIPTTGGTVIYSNQYVVADGVGHASRAFDGANDPSVWVAGISGSAPEWIGYHFSEAVDPLTVEITVYYNTLVCRRYPNSFLIQCSDDGVEWVTVRDYSNVDWGFGWTYWYSEEYGWQWSVTGDATPTKTFTLTDTIESVVVPITYVEVIETTVLREVQSFTAYIEVVASLTYTNLDAARPPKRLGSVIS